jgi:tRNA A37 threonylcarbamoyladenosine modification protein TsaB
MGDALSIPTYAVCSLDGIAPSAQDEGDLIVVTDARRKEVYWARYDAARERIEGPFVDKPQDVPLATDYAGIGAALYADRFPGRSGNDYPDPVALIALARNRVVQRAPSEALIPLYLRQPDAVVPGTPKTVRQ